MDDSKIILHSRSNGHPNRKELVLPLDWGIAFALAHKRKLFFLAVLPMAAELCTAYIQHSVSLQMEHLLIALVLTAMANAWLLAAVLQFCIKQVRLHGATSSDEDGGKEGEEASQPEMTLGKILPSLPKIFACYVVLLIIVAVGFYSLIIPGLVFIGFFIWAPAFCIGELCVVEKAGLGANGSESSRRSEADESLEERRLSPFRWKSAWELGLVRSARLASSNFPNSFQLAFQLALLALTVNVVPAALLEVLFSHSAEFGLQALKIVAASLLSALVIGAWAGAFVNLLSLEAKRELGVLNYVDPASFCQGKAAKVRRFERRAVPQMLLVAAAAVSSWFLFESEIVRSRMPESVSIEVYDTEISDKDLVFTLHLTDSKDEFRWFDPMRFRIGFEPLGVESRADASPGLEEKAKKYRYIEPLSARVYSLDGKLLSERSYFSFKHPLKLELRAKKPSEMPKQGDFQIYYMGAYGSGLGPVRYEGSYGAGW